MADIPQLAESKELDFLGVYHLKRVWSKTLRERAGMPTESTDEKHLDRLVIDALGLGLLQTIQHLCMHAPSFSEFEDWIISTAGRPSEDLVSRLNADIMETSQPDATVKWLAGIEASESVLNADDLSFWETNGYVILRDAVCPEARMAAEQAIWSHVGADTDTPESWYQTGAQGIMVELIQHPAFEKTRQSPRIHKAFAQLWNTEDLWVTADRCGFHVPQKEGYPFPGPDLHWDINFSDPPRFATQGILYLTDTPPEQGALTVVPGFHKCLETWLQNLPPGSDPQKKDLHSLGAVPIGGKAGDMIIWNHALPHGSRPNLGTHPRIVQYINMYPGRNHQIPGCYQFPPRLEPCD